ncbi:hypothetical protein E2493_08710 [Sphingomonas parva]|uniref:Heme-copper oxidase subunit III family profile domain-containing protein n=1 Tax=Sphingomonas parva TaxID=2555898 RepID=A0A4Y8ZRS5_9SPHN|nr:hypothetical protein [Sphingomonas parva]TFI58703.1 hypothetical protein E2493_08710 [Sphingomonas parva]
MRLIAALTEKPWLTPGPGPSAPSAPAESESAARPWDKGVGLTVFLLVVTLLFTLMSSAYVMRMGGHAGHAGGGDWRPIGEPPLLWLNTGLLAAASLAFHAALGRARAGRPRRAGAALALGGALGLAFVAGQLLLWRALAGCFAGEAAAFCPAAAHGIPRGWAGDPAAAFFYLISGAHGLHILGGLVACALTGGRLARVDPGSLAARTGAARAVQLCARYWDFMALVWLALMGLFVST